MKEVISLNGEFISQRKFKMLQPLERLLTGPGLFETMRSYKGKIVYLNEHLKRLRVSCKLIGIRPAYPRYKLKEIIRESVEKAGGADCRIRVVLAKTTAGTDTLIAVKKYAPPARKKYLQGFSACISRHRQDEASFLSGIKTTERLLHEQSLQEAQNNGFDEAVILNSKGYLAEASRSNIFFVKEETLFTPGPSSGCLAGITRQAVFDLADKYGVKVSSGKFTLRDLESAEEAFLTNSLIGIMPLTKIGNKRIGRGKNILTRFFMDKYKRLLEKPMFLGRKGIQ